MAGLIAINFPNFITTFEITKHSILNKTFYTSSPWISRNFSIKYMLRYWSYKKMFVYNHNCEENYITCARGMDLLSDLKNISKMSCIFQSNILNWSYLFLKTILVGPTAISPIDDIAFQCLIQIFLPGQQFRKILASIFYLF